MHIVGASFAPILQIVPVVTLVDVDAAYSVAVTGQGFVEGNGTTYQFGTATVTDLSTDTVINVFSSGTTVDLTLPIGGPGSFTVTTAGGTSAPKAWNVISPFSSGTVVDVAYEAVAGEVLTASSTTGLIYRINPSTGAVLGSFNIPVQSSASLGLDISPVATTLRNTATSTDVPIPAGSLIVFNAAPTPDRIVAMNPATGAILATLNLVGNFGIVGGAITLTGRILVLDPASNSLREIHPLTGAEIVAGGFAAGMDIVDGDIAVHPTTGNIWVASSSQTSLREYTAAGVFVRSIDVTPQGVSTELTGLAFRPVAGDFDVLASSNRGVIYILPDPLVSIGDATGPAGSTVTVPINIDNSNHLESATFLVQYDSDLLDVDPDAVHWGSLTSNGTLTSFVDDAAGTIKVSLTIEEPLGTQSGSLVEIDYQIKQSATGEATLDLQEAVLNDGALILSQQPVNGADGTDGLITIEPTPAPSPQRVLSNVNGKEMSTQVQWSVGHKLVENVAFPGGVSAGTSARDLNYWATESLFKRTPNGFLDSPLPVPGRPFADFTSSKPDAHIWWPQHELKETRQERKVKIKWD